MEKPYVFEIRIEGHLSDRWSSWFEGLAVKMTPDGQTVLRGEFVDQAELFGVLTRIHALNLILVAVNRKEP
jgi:hypothetical protein